MFYCYDTMPVWVLYKEIFIQLTVLEAKTQAPVCPCASSFLDNPISVIASWQVCVIGRDHMM